MEDSLKKFRDEVTTIKEGLASIKANKNGFHEISEKDFCGIVRKLLHQYKVFLEAGGEIDEQSDQIINGLLVFQNVQLDQLNWAALKETTKNETRISGKFDPLSFRFVNSHIQSMYLNNQLNGYVVKDFYLSGSALDYLEINENFFELATGIKWFEANSNTKIKQLTFRGNYQQPLFFANTEIHSLSFIQKPDPSFQAIYFHDCRFHTFSMNNVTFNSTVSFQNCQFRKSPKFHNAKFHSDTSFTGTVFDDVTSNSSTGDYRALKQAMHEIGDEQKAVEFHALEMDARHNTVIKKGHHSTWPIWFASWTLKKFNDYGRDFLKPFLWLFGSFLLFAWLFYVIGALGCNLSDVVTGSWLEPRCNNYDDLSVIHSASMSFGPLGLLIEPDAMFIANGYGKILSVLQTILSSIFWFVIIIQFRRQFKL